MRNKVGGQERQPMGCGTAVLIGTGLVFAAIWLVPSRQEQSGASIGSAEAVPTLSGEAVAACRQFLTLAQEKGLIRKRPQPNRINVDDLMWAGLDAETKDRTLQAVACDIWGTAMPAGMDHVVAYGFRSGKRLQILTSAGMARE